MKKIISMVVMFVATALSYIAEACAGATVAKGLVQCPATEEFDALVRELFPDIGEGSRVTTPLNGVRFNKVKIGRNVVVQSNCLMMSAGGITIEDEALIAANVQLISNNHDPEDRMVITCKPVRICRRAWIGAGATILLGVTQSCSA